MAKKKTHCDAATFKPVVADVLNNNHTTVVLVGGAPGGGKTTKMQLLLTLAASGLGGVPIHAAVIDTSAEYHWHLRTNTDLGKIFREGDKDVLGGALAADSAIIEMVGRALMRESQQLRGLSPRAVTSNMVIVIGTPRTVEQAKAVIGLRRVPKIGLFFDISRTTCLERIRNRRAQLLGTGGRLARSYDGPGVIERRWEIYQHQTVPAFKLLEKHRDGAFCHIDSEGPIKEQIIKVCRHLQRYGLVDQVGLQTMTSRLNNQNHPATEQIRMIEDPHHIGRTGIMVEQTTVYGLQVFIPAGMPVVGRRSAFPDTPSTRTSSGVRAATQASVS